jgi:hypothetical protein
MKVRAIRDLVHGTSKYCLKGEILEVTVQNHTSFQMYAFYEHLPDHVDWTWYIPEEHFSDYFIKYIELNTSKFKLI